jgi:hypothetical protein
MNASIADKCAVSLFRRVEHGGLLLFFKEFLIAVFSGGSGSSARDIVMPFKRGRKAGLLLDFGNYCPYIVFRILYLAGQHEGLRKILPVEADESFFDAVGHAVIEVDDTLPAVLSF